MKRIALILGVALLASLLVASDSFAQPGGRGGRGGFGGPGGFGGGFGGAGGVGGLLRSPEVQKELGLLDEQIADIEKAMNEINEEMRENRPNFRGQDLTDEERQEMIAEMQKQMAKMQEKQAEAISSVLLPDQMERLEQIEVQAAGFRAIMIPRVKKALEITDSQEKKIQDTMEEAQAKMREEMQAIFGGGRGGQGGPGGGRGNFEGMREKMEEMQKGLEKDVMGILTSSQKNKLDDLKGEPFDVESLQRGRGRGGRGPGGPGGPGGNRRRGGGNDN